MKKQDASVDKTRFACFVYVDTYAASIGSYAILNDTFLIDFRRMEARRRNIVVVRGRRGKEKGEKK